MLIKGVSDELLVWEKCPAGLWVVVTPSSRGCGGGRSGRGQRPQTEVVAAGGAVMAAAVADPHVASRRITEHGQDVLLSAEQHNSINISSVVPSFCLSRLPSFLRLYDLSLPNERAKFISFIIFKSLVAKGHKSLQ